MKPFTNWNGEFGISSRGSRRNSASPWRSTQHPRGARSSRLAGGECRGCWGLKPPCSHTCSVPSARGQAGLQGSLLIPTHQRPTRRAHSGGVAPHAHRGAWSSGVAPAVGTIHPDLSQPFWPDGQRVNLGGVCDLESTFLYPM